MFIPTYQNIVEATRSTLILQSESRSFVNVTMKPSNPIFSQCIEWNSYKVAMKGVQNFRQAAREIEELTCNGSKMVALGSFPHWTRVEATLTMFRGGVQLAKEHHVVDTGHGRTFLS